MHHPHEPIIYSRKKFSKLMKAPTNVTSHQGMHKSTKNNNTTISATHIVMQIMSEIYMTDSQSHQHSISSMVTSQNSVPKTNLRPQEESPMQKQEQCTQECQIKIVSETYLNRLVTPQDLHQKYTRITKQQLNKYCKIESIPNTDLSMS